jgi:hypothetical protein
MRLSVALPTFNGGKYLLQQLESIQTQSRLPDELIITDDASNDNTVTIVERFQKVARFPVRLFNNPVGLGCNENFAKAIAQCSGDVIALCDQDDVWSPLHLERLLAPFQVDEAVTLVVSNSELVDENLRSLGRTIWKGLRFSGSDARRVNRGPALRQWIKHPAISGHASAFRADLVPIILPFPHRDYDQWLALICAACGKVKMVDEVLTLYRQHSDQTIGFRPESLTQKMSSEKTVPRTHFSEQIEELNQLHSRLVAYPEIVRLCDYNDVLRERMALWEQRKLMRQGHALRRVIMATRLLLSGRYHRIGRGFLTYARDLRG